MSTTGQITDPGLIVVSGSGKKVGKTYLVTALIRKFSLQFQLTGLKISPHIHDDLGGAELVAHIENRYNIYREYQVHRKNSGQFLHAGASRAFFMETGDEYLAEAYHHFRQHIITGKDALICESGALADIIRPAFHIHITDNQAAGQEGDHGPQKKADLVLPARDFDPMMVINRISFDERGWTPSGW
jgi:hypothetical protein